MLELCPKCQNGLQKGERDNGKDGRTEYPKLLNPVEVVCNSGVAEKLEFWSGGMSELGQSSEVIKHWSCHSPKVVKMSE